VGHQAAGCPPATPLSPNPREGTGRLPYDDSQHEPERDLLDRLPVLGRATTQLERSFGPSCLLSLIIVFLLAVVLKRFLSLSWIGLGLLSIVIWLGVLTLLIRWRGDRVADEDWE
jgi:hypothetical protein